MKKAISMMLVSALLMGAMPLVPLSADAAADQYEFEKGTITVSGDNHAEIATVKGASGGRAVDLRDGGNRVSVTVNAAEEGTYRITMRYSPPYDENGKIQNLLING